MGLLRERVAFFCVGAAAMALVAAVANWCSP